LLEQLALAHFGEHAGLAGTGHHFNAPAATLCYRFALAAILWFKPRPMRWSAPTDQKRVCGRYCHIMGYSTANLCFK